MPPLDPEIPGFCPWGPWGTYFDDLELIIDPQERILGYIISCYVMKLYVVVDVLMHVHSFCVMNVCG